MVKVKEWAKCDEAPQEKVMGWAGGFFNFDKKDQRWKDYIDEFDDDAKPYLEALRENIVKNNIRLTGEEHQEGKGTPVFDDGTAFFLSYRAWGDLMAAIWSEEEDKDYSYMDFYMKEGK